jgi:transcriptional regulator with XRE-family HTH domain
MTDAGRRLPRKRSALFGTRSQLGGLLADLRRARGFTLRQVEEATDHAVSNAYLSQLEKGKVQKPSPNVLHSLAAVYAVPYESLMEKAGYLLPSTVAVSKRRTRLAAFALDDLTPAEEDELIKYLAFIRSRDAT